MKRLRKAVLLCCCSCGENADALFTCFIFGLQETKSACFRTVWLFINLPFYYCECVCAGLFFFIGFFFFFGLFSLEAELFLFFFKES